MASDETFSRVAADQSTPARQTGGLIAALGAATGLGALAASSCCVLPLALGGLGVGAGVFTALEALVPWRVPLLLVSALAVAIGWWFYARRRLASCAPGSACAPGRSRLSLALLSVATALVATAAAWGYFESALVKLLRIT